MLPLRAFLGITFLYAGLSKIMDPHYLDESSPLGVHSQMVHAAATSPIGGLVSLSADHATMTGLLIAFGELAVGLGALLGLFTRLAALGGVLLALSFFLTVSWTTRPYYYGADIGFAFAWTPLLIAGDGGVLSVSARLRAAVRRKLELPAQPTPRESVATADEVERRTVLRGSLIAGVTALVGGVTGSVVAFARRTPSAAASTAASTPSTAGPAPSTAGSTPSAAGSGTSAAGSTPSAAGSGTSAAGGTVIAAASSVPVGASKSFTAPDGHPAHLLHPAAGAFVALSAVCTHQGCPVSYIGPGFQCPCHGATYDQNGQVTGGPAPAPLTKIPIKVTNGEITTA